MKTSNEVKLKKKNVFLLSFVTNRKLTENVRFLRSEILCDSFETKIEVFFQPTDRFRMEKLQPGDFKIRK